MTSEQVKLLQVEVDKQKQKYLTAVTDIKSSIEQGYDFESITKWSRDGITPKQFFSYCDDRDAGIPVPIERRIEQFLQSAIKNPEYRAYFTIDGDKPTFEGICRIADEILRQEDLEAWEIWTALVPLRKFDDYPYEDYYDENAT